jgi:hypothetical protein
VLRADTPHGFEKSSKCGGCQSQQRHNYVNSLKDGPDLAPLQQKQYRLQLVRKPVSKMMPRGREPASSPY